MMSDMALWLLITELECQRGWRFVRCDETSVVFDVGFGRQRTWVPDPQLRWDGRYW